MKTIRKKIFFSKMRVGIKVKQSLFNCKSVKTENVVKVQKCRRSNPTTRSQKIWSETGS